MNSRPDISRHPCFNEEAKGICGRIHLPVAPKCNIKCNYCDRRYDCVNESRPGVTSALVTPAQAVHYLATVLDSGTDISVVGIAGPGDPLANPDETFKTMEKVRKEYPGMLFCLSTNGLALPGYVDQIADIGVSHVTITVNAVDPVVGEKIYPWARDGKVIYRGTDAAKLLLERQREGIVKLKERGIIVKVNTILIPGVNDDHVEEVAKEMASLGVDLLNIIAMVPNEGTPFGELPEPDNQTITHARTLAEKHLPQMKHCQRCRADAVGLIEKDESARFAEALRESSNLLPIVEDGRPYVAVATREGILVNHHLGEAAEFQVWEQKGDDFTLVATRAAPERGGGAARWRELASILSDCRAVLASGYGEIPGAILEKEGLLPVEMSGFIEMGLTAVYSGKDITSLKKRSTGGCAKGLGCGGDGGGCG